MTAGAPQTGIFPGLSREEVSGSNGPRYLLDTSSQTTFRNAIIEDLFITRASDDYDTVVLEKTVERLPADSRLYRDVEQPRCVFV